MDPNGFERAKSRCWIHGSASSPGQSVRQRHLQSEATPPRTILPGCGAGAVLDRGSQVETEGEVEGEEEGEEGEMEGKILFSSATYFPRALDLARFGYLI